MKVLSIGSDRSLFIRDSEAQKRIKEYGKLFDELHIVVFSGARLGNSDIELGDNIFIYPTNHRYNILYLWNIFLIIKNFKLKIKNSQNDFVISCQDPFESGLAGWLASLWLKLPLHIQIHTDIFSPYFSAESFMNKVRVSLAKFLLPRAYGIRAVSERIKQSLIAQFPSYQLPITNLPIFVDIKKIQNAKIKIDLRQKYSGYDFIILMASRLTREKNIGMAVGAMAEIIKKSPIADYRLPKNPLLLIVGDGPEKEYIQSLIADYRLQNNAVIEPWTNDLISYYKSADLFLLTSNYEGYGRTIVESMAAGLPVVMTGVGLAGELLVDDLDGRVVPVGDMRALAGVVSELMKDPAKREEFGINCVKLTQKLPDKNEYMKKYKDSLMMVE